MELHFFSFPLVLASLLFLLMILKKNKRSKTSSLDSKSPPSPWKLPLIGNLHHLVVGLPHHSLRNLAKKHGPLMHLQLGEISTIIVSSAKMAKELMKTHDLMFMDRPKILAATIMSYDCKGMAFSPYGDYWRQMRKICILELLSAKRVQSFQALREEVVSNFIRSIYQKVGSPINLSEMVMSLTIDITSKAAFGTECKDKQAFVSATKESVKVGGGFGVHDLFPSKKFLHVIGGNKSKLYKAHKKVDMILKDILQEHRNNRTGSKSNKSSFEEDLVDVLLNLQESSELEFPITTDNIKAVILDIFTAGSETSSTAIEWAMSEIVKNPRVMKKAQAEVRQVLQGKKEIKETDILEMNYLKCIIKETLRLHPPLPLLLPRECREKCKIDIYEIPRKTKLIVNAWAIGRDPENWNNADSFEPERFNDISIDYKGNSFEFIPFGAGRRICPGIMFGVANIELALAQLLYHFDWKLCNGAKPEELDMNEEFGATVRRRDDLYLIPTPYSALPVD